MMKKILFAVTLVSAFALFATNDKFKDMKPEAAGAKDAPTGVEWQNANEKALASATDEEALAAVFADGTSVGALLARLEGAYFTDALIATKVAAVSQYVMIGADAAWYEFWVSSRDDEREVWCDALIRTAMNAKDAYVKQFCLDQLRWCGKCSHSSRVREIGVSAKEKEVKDFAEIVVRELENCTCCR